jgi:hypothetical protein
MCLRELGNLLGPACPPFITRRSNAAAFLYVSTAEIQGCANGHEQHALVHHPIPHKCMSLSSSALFPFIFAFPPALVYISHFLIATDGGGRSELCATNLTMYFDKLTIPSLLTPGLSQLPPVPGNPVSSVAALCRCTEKVSQDLSSDGTQVWMELNF